MNLFPHDDTRAPVPRPPQPRSARGQELRAILFDRDGTLIVDVPYNGDPGRVRPMPTAAAAVEAARERGLAVGVISNQSGISRGYVSAEKVRRVNVAVEAALGPFDVWRVCPHAPEDGCACRKPQPGMVLSAAAMLGLRPAQVAMIGDIGADIEAGRAAGARTVLVPTADTRAEEITGAPLVAATLREAVELLFREGAPREDSQ